MSDLRARIAGLLAARDPLAAARAASFDPRAPITYGSDDAPDGWLVDGDEERPVAEHRAAHREGRPSEAALAYGAGRDVEEVAARLAELAELAAETGLLRAVCPVPADGTADRPGSWGVEDLTVIATCRLALPDGVAVRPHWRRLGPAACQIAAAFGATDWRVPGRRPVRPGRAGRRRGPRGGAAMRKLRVGRISALNMYPIYHGLERAGDPALTFTDGVPTELNRALLDGRLDVSAVSSIAFARHADALHAGAGGLDHRRRRGRLDPALLPGAVRRGGHGGGDPAQRDLGGAAADPARPAPVALRDPRRARRPRPSSAWTACC